MAEVVVNGTVSAPLEKVWAIVRDFGDLSWARIHDTKLEGEGVGAVRTFTSTGGDLVVQERLEHLDEAAHHLSYSLIDAGVIPWTSYLAHIRLSSVDGHTHVEWWGTFEPRNVTEEQASGIVRSIYENGIRSLQRATA